ncbi:MAG: hypothetical protein ABII82_18685 [Verrucomicrobiota bacterium]
MKDARFNELLNLYLDHRLSEADAAELEAEVTRNPVRRRIYNGYCRMQRACNVLFESEREQAPRACSLTRALEEVNRKLAGEVVESRSVSWLVWSGALAAACVVVVSVTVVLRESPVGGAAPSVTVADSSSDALSAPAAVEPASVVLASVEPTPATTVVQPTIDQQQWSRIAAQRWIDAEAESLMAGRLVEDDRFVIHHAGDDGDVPSFQLRASTRGELTSYQFQR